MSGKGITVAHAHTIVEESQGLPQGTLSNFLRWLPVVQAIEATVRAIKDQAVGERVAIPTVRGIRIGERSEDFDGAGLTRRK